MHPKIQQYFLEEQESSEQKTLFHQLENDESIKNDFIRFQNVYALSMLLTRPDDETEGRQYFGQFLRRIQSEKRKKRYIAIAKYAAMMTIAILSTLFVYSFLSHKEQASAINTLYVPAGQRARLSLEDGTVVWLNAQSTLTYPAQFSGKKREVTLTGEAFFDVAKNPKKTFIVSTQHVEMKVLGTQFNVYSYPNTDYIRTDLLEGSVMVNQKNTPEKNVILHPSEQVIIKNGKMFLSKIENSDYFLWKEGIYAFNNERLLDIIEKLQLYYDVKIIVKDPQIFNVKYTGKFRQRDGIDEILRIIQKIQHFQVKKDIDKNTITLSK